MKALIIGSRKNGNVEIDRLKEEGVRCGVEWVIKQFDEWVLDTKNLVQLRQELDSYGFIISRLTTEVDEAMVASEIRWNLLQMFPDIRKRWLNGNSYFQFPGFSKIIQVMKLGSAGVLVPDSEYGANAESLKFPIVMKGLSGNNGQSVYLIHSSDEYREKAEQFGKGKFFTQEVLPVKGDYRVLVVDNKVLGIMKRTPEKGKFLANISQGGRGEKIDNDVEFGHIALKAAKVFGCDYAGVDLMRNSEGKLVVLEVNRAAGFVGFEKVTRINVAKKIIEYLVAKQQ